ncbi:MAG: glycosyltransferase family 4 protein [Rhodospirillales bacterium]
MALQSAAALNWFATALFYQPDRLPYALLDILPGPMRRKVQPQLQKITNAQIEAAAVRTVGALEWTERLATKVGWPRAADFFNVAGNRKFQRGVIRLLAREPAQRIWGYDTSCADVFARAKPDIVRVLDRSIGHPRALRAILEREQALAPEFFMSSSGKPSDAGIEEADRELALADHIVVGSRFCADTMLEAGAAPEKLHVVPYGYDEELFDGARPVRVDLGKLPVRFLFVGTVTPRKGVHHLFEAFRRIPREQAILTVGGPLAIPPKVMARYQGHIDYLGTLSRAEVARELARAHCFIFPSLFEGGGIVLYEAIAAGLGLIHSRATGDAVQEGGSNGIRLDAVSVETIQAAIERVIRQPEMLRAWSDASWSLRKDNSWGVYRRRIVDLLPLLV